MKSWAVHYKNKYPGSQVVHSEESLDVYKNGEHLVAVRKVCGSWMDKSEELGCKYKHDLAPIAKEARVHKLHSDGKIGLDEMHEERKQISQSWVEGDQIESEAAYKARKAQEVAEAKAKQLAKAQD